MGTIQRAPRTCAVVIGGGAIAALDIEPDLVIAADGGLDVARAAGLAPTMLVGDLDSISDAGRRWAHEHHVEEHRHSTDKDHTDTALALHHAGMAGADEIVLLGPGATDRLDHLLGAIIALGAAPLAAASSVSARLGATTVHVLHADHSTTIDRPAGQVFSLLALHGTCTGVTVDGARWPLRGATLAPADTLGISNESIGGPVTVSVGEGVLTVVIPGVTG